MKLIHAYTETEYPKDVGYPAYLNLTRQDNGKYKLTVRSQGDGGKNVASIVMEGGQLESFANDIFVGYYDEGDPPPATPAGVTATEPKLTLALPDYEKRRIVIASDEVIDGERLVCVAIKDPAAGQDDARDAALEEAARAAESVGRLVGASNDRTYVLGTSADAARAIRALKGKPAMSTAPASEPVTPLFGTSSTITPEYKAEQADKNRAASARLDLIASEPVTAKCETCEGRGYEPGSAMALNPQDCEACAGTGTAPTKAEPVREQPAGAGAGSDDAWAMTLNTLLYSYRHCGHSAMERVKARFIAHIDATIKAREEAARQQALAELHPAYQAAQDKITALEAALAQRGGE